MYVIHLSPTWIVQIIFFTFHSEMTSYNYNDVWCVRYILRIYRYIGYSFTNAHTFNKEGDWEREREREREMNRERKKIIKTSLFFKKKDFGVLNFKPMERSFAFLSLSSTNRWLTNLLYSTSSSLAFVLGRISSGTKNRT